MDTLRPLTPKQQEIIEIIRKGLMRNGQAPTVREIGKMSGLRSSCSVQKHLNQLEAKGYIKREQYKYRSVETWLNEKGHWKMIGSETLALQEDPATVALDQKTLDEYVGAYQASSGMGIEFTRQGSRLFAAINGGSGVEQEAQARDIVFTPGHGATPKVFQRDTHGKVTGFVYLRGSHSLTFTRKTA